jgi:hypothetical protein
LFELAFEVEFEFEFALFLPENREFAFTPVPVFSARP